MCSKSYIVVGGAFPAVYVADLCPTVAHLPSLWTLAYDQFPLDVRREKARVLGRAADEGDLVIFEHDPKVRAAHLRRDDRGRPVVERTVEL